jgi:hypothetical protein
MASSSDWGKVEATYLTRRDTSDLRNQLLSHIMVWVFSPLELVLGWKNAKNGV